jgi:uncharacterized protein (UPF0261 family)
MSRKIVIIGTLDTKGSEHWFLKEKIEETGLETIVIDTGLMDPPRFNPDIPREEVCQAAGFSIKGLLEKKDRSFALEVMAKGVSRVVRRLYEEGQLDGIISLGGGQGTYISTMAMKELPIGIPKVMVSTQASGDVSRFIGYKDITLIHSVTDILGLNSFTARIFSQAAAAVCAMVQVSWKRPLAAQVGKPLIAITMFGLTTPCVMKIKKLIEEKYQYHEAIVFHARGTGGRAMEELIREGVIKGVIDITTTEWADELVGGIRSAGPHRLEAAGEVGIPQLIGPGALDMVNFGPRDTVPMKFNGRKFYTHTPLVTLMRTTVAENRRLGEIIAEKLNQAKGKTLVIIPLRGFSTIDEKDSPFFDPDADRAFAEGLGEHIRKDIEVLKLDCHINDDRFAEEAAKQFTQMMS